MDVVPLTPSPSACGGIGVEMKCPHCTYGILFLVEKKPDKKCYRCEACHSRVVVDVAMIVEPRQEVMNFS